MNTGREEDESDGSLGTLHFCPEESYAMFCSGSMPGFGDSAKVMHDSFLQKMGIPASNIALRTLQSGTKENVELVLKEYAEKVGENGILFFTFCGHGIVDDSLNMGFLRSVGSSSVDDGLTFRVFDACLESARAKKVVFILDCCFGGQVAGDIVDSDAKLPSELHILSASGAAEKSYYLSKLNCTIFIYFLTNYLHRHGRAGVFPKRQALAHAQQLCPVIAMLKAHSEEEYAKQAAKGISLVPNPLALVKYRPSGTEGGIEPNLSPDAPLTADCLNFFLSDDGKYENLLPQKLHEWFQSTAIHSVRVLFQHGYLKRGSSEYEQMAICVLCLLAESAAKIVSDAHCCDACVGGDDESAVSCDDGDLPATPGNADVFLQVGRYFLWLFEEAVHGSDGYDIEEKPQVLVSHLIMTVDRYQKHVRSTPRSDEPTLCVLQSQLRAY